MITLVKTFMAMVLFLAGHLWWCFLNGSAERHLSFHYAVYSWLMCTSGDLDINNVIWKPVSHSEKSSSCN